MKGLLLVALLATAGCATTRAAPEGAPADIQRTVNVCIHNLLVIWMASGTHLRPANLCEENEFTKEAVL